MKIKISLTILLVLLLTTSCSRKNPTQKDEGNVINKTFLNHIKTTKAIVSNREQELVLTGKVECDPDKVMNYSPLVSGMIDRTYFSLGDRVNKGQTMLDIRSSELSSLQSELIIARRELQSAESMYEDKLISEKELIEARSKYEKLQADIALYGENRGGGMFSVKSPMAGYVVVKNASPGSTMSAGDDPLFSIADLSTVWVIGNVYAGDLQFVREGMEVEMRTLSYPGELFKGKINSLSQVFDPEEKVLKARIVMSNNDLKLKPDMSMLITLKNETNNRYVAIPSNALIFDDDQNFVVVEESLAKFVIKKVALLDHSGQTSYIASGLSEGDNVVTENQLLIYSGLKENN